MKSSKEILSINLRYIRKIYNLSQEEFAAKVGSSLVYINQLENSKRNTSLEMLDKLTKGINTNIDSKLNITSSDLLRYNESHITNYTRIDEKNKFNLFLIFQ